MALPSGAPRAPGDVILSGGRPLRIIDLPGYARARGLDPDDLPYVIRILLENLLRSQALGRAVSEAEIALLHAHADHVGADLPLFVSRVILPDSSGVPVLQDLAALRDALARAGGDPRRVDMQVPVDLVVDHSLQVDHWGTADAMQANMRRELERDGERFAFIGWAQQAFRGLRVFPPGSGIIHQVNLERIATVVATAAIDGEDWAFPDFVIGGDSHTPMVNGLGVLGWGVGGIDAEAALLGHAYTFPVPEVVGVELTGVAAPATWTTDIALLVTQRLRRENVSNCAVEFFGPAADALSVPERATLANMAPEYGATCGFFAVDARTLEYLRMTGRSAEQIERVETYCRRTGLFREAGARPPRYRRTIRIDLGDARPGVAGPHRPQDRLALEAVAGDFRSRLGAPLETGGFGTTERAVPPDARLPQGAVVVAAITSCTNTSNPQVMFAAGLVARNAVARGLTVAPWVKTSLAPGSPAVIRYLDRAGLLRPLEELGFHLVGFGCTTCGGKSGPLAPEVAEQVEGRQLVVTSVLSGNRNFAGRIHKLVRANYIGAPPIVVGYALAGRIDIDLTREAIGTDTDGKPVYWADLQPDPVELQELVARVGELAGFGAADEPGGHDGHDEPTATPSAGALAPDRRIEVQWCPAAQSGVRYRWDPRSRYLLEPPFFADGADLQADGIAELSAALRDTRVLAAFDDSLTTDHISPGGEIPEDTPAGRYLIEAGIAPRDFNSYVGRRGNFEVMVRGTFANVRLRNALTPEREGGWTLHFPDRTVTTIHDAAQRYRSARTATIVLAGKEYGTGSSRDWAAKGTALLGVRAVIAQSYERIHRANLIGMGVLPLRFASDEGWRQLGLDGSERIAFGDVSAGIREGVPIAVTATHPDGRVIRFDVVAETRTSAERALMMAGGLPRSVLQGLLAADGPRPHG